VNVPDLLAGDKALPLPTPEALAVFAMRYNERDIEKHYQENLSAARQVLASLHVAEGREPTIKALNG